MEEIISNFIKQFGIEKYKQCLKSCGHHSGVFGNTIKNIKNDKDKLIFALLEMIDFECFKYNDKCNILDEADIKRFLLEHKKTVMSAEIEPPSYLGLFSGAFNFLR